ncbi:MAG: OmpA family protein [Desulfobacula sp.]|nr:OmpA family protein [Desulfobacula sp.]
MEKTISKVLAILLFIACITGGIFYKQLYDIKNELKKSMEETEQLEEQVLVSRKTLEKTSKLLEEMQKTNELENKEALKSIAQQKHSIKELEEQLKSATEQVRKLEIEAKDFKKEIASNEEKLKVEVEKANAISQTLEDEKKQYEQKINSLTSKISNFETELEKIKKTHSKDLEKIGQLEETNHKDRLLIETGNKKNLGLEANILESNRKVASLENINSQSRIKLEESQERIQSLQMEVDLKSKQLDKIAKELKSTLSLKKEALKSIAQLEHSIKELEEQLKSATEQIRKLKIEAKDFKKEIASNEEKLKVEVEKSNAISQALEDEKKLYEQKINSLTSQISKFETELEIIGETRSKDLEKIGQVEEINHKDRLLIEAGNKKILGLEANILESNRNVASLENINSQSRIQLEESQKRIQSLQMEVDLKSKQIDKIAKELKNTLLLKKDETQKAREHILFLEKEMEKKLSMTGNKIAELKSQVTEGMTIKQRATQLEKEKKEALLQAQTLKKTYNELVEQLKHELDSKNATLKEFEKKLTITFVDRILFDSGMAVLNQEGKTTLGKVGQILKNSPGSRLRIIGHTDNVVIAEGFRYKFPSNWELSASRASSVARFFHENNGIDPEKMEVVGKSFYHPISDNTTPEGRSKNRRVEIVIIPDM